MLVEEWVPHTKEEKNITSIYVSEALDFEVQPPCSPDLSPLAFHLRGHLKTPRLFSSNWEWKDASSVFLSHSNHSQPPWDLWKGATVRDYTCPYVHWLRCRTFWALVNCDLINNKNSTFIKSGTWVVKVVRQLYVKCCIVKVFMGPLQWLRGLRRGSTAARLLGLWVRIPPRAWKSVSCECCVLSSRGLCDGLVPRPEESYRVWCV
jgi:hypothetical protein